MYDHRTQTLLNVIASMRRAGINVSEEAERAMITPLRCWYCENRDTRCPVCGPTAKSILEHGSEGEP